MARRRRKKLRKFLSRHRFLVIVLCVLLILSSSSYLTIRWIEHRAQSTLDSVPDDSSPVVDLAVDPRAYIIAERAKEFEKIEPMLYVLLIFIPASFVLIGLICFWRAVIRERPWQVDRSLNADQQARAAKHRHTLVQKYRR